ncbi:uncharacterized protein LOC121777443 [Salvia splendens]|uniref:uncharacterized protein LOC121777443 n=1 Tax=Salvia splendens TaxID=180675 RepID=UPI001C266273|nr:uncharacterized protein LOC121777443 [Salvia splendens]
MPLHTPVFDPDEDSAFDAIDQYHEGREHSHAQGSGALPQQEEEEEEEVEGHRRRNRRNHRRGRSDPAEEFQVGTSAQLGEMFSYMQNMSNTWDNRWVEQQEVNAFNQQGWEAQDDWRAAEQDFGEAQRVADVQQRQQIVELQMMAAEARAESQTMSGDIAYLIGAFDDLNAYFPPPPPPQE